jgi:hypothetical protein
MTKAQLAVQAIQEKYGTFDPSKLQVQRWQYYDNVRLNVAGTNRLTFFANPIGAVDPVSGLNKSLEEVNIRRSGELDEAFVIMALKTEVAILPMSRQPAGVSAVTNAVVQALTPVHAALRNLYMQGVLSVAYGQKQYIQIEQPFQWCPPGYGPSIRTISASDTGAAAFPPLSQHLRPSNDPRDIYQMTPPIMVEKGQTFSAQIDFFNANTPVIPQVGGANVAINIGVTFDGYVLRPIQ